MICTACGRTGNSVCPGCRHHTMLAQTPTGRRVVLDTHTGSPYCRPLRPPLPNGGGYKRKARR